MQGSHVYCNEAILGYAKAGFFNFDTAKLETRISGTILKVLNLAKLNALISQKDKEQGQAQDQ